MKRDQDIESMSLYEQIRQGLSEAIAQTKGKVTLTTTILPKPAPTISKNRVVSIRKRTKMSQAVFACFLNVPTKTLQSWEQGARKPKAGEARLLQIAEASPDQFTSLIRFAGSGAKAGARSAAIGKRKKIPA
ncbi:MAG: helix-turn-helix domain-containing protein [Phycisphaerales bacterium]